MRVLALGGCGEMGRHAVRTLLGWEAFERITVADLREDEARRFAAACGPRAVPARVDVSDPASLAAALADVDVVVNTVGPYCRFGTGVLRACLERGCHYFDLNDDWEPTLEMLALREEARRRGVTAVIGMGASPGVSNLLAARAIAELDVAEEVYTVWDLESATPEEVGPRPSAATIHGMHQLTGRIRVFRDGRLIDCKPIEKHRLLYPGIGAVAAWSIGHPESVTLPRTYPSLRSSTNLFMAPRTTVLALRILTLLVNAGLVTVEGAAWFAERFEGPRKEVKRPELALAGSTGEGRPGPPPMFALAVGRKAGCPASVAATILTAPAGGMGAVTGVPLAVGVCLLARQRLRDHGVFAPEGAIDPEDFFGAIAPLCTPAGKGPSDILLVTRSWEIEKA